MDDVVRVLEGQLPRYFRPVIEFQEILKAHGYGVGQAEGAMERLQDNFYIVTCDEPTIAYHERLLGIDGAGMGLEERRKVVMMRYSMHPLYTLPFLRELLHDMYGEGRYKVDVDPVACTATVSVMAGRQGSENVIFDLILDILPAHLYISAGTMAERIADIYAGGVHITYAKIHAGPEPAQYKITRDTCMDMGVGTLEHVRAVYRPGKGE